MTDEMAAKCKALAKELAKVHSREWVSVKIREVTKGQFSGQWTVSINGHIEMFATKKDCMIWASAVLLVWAHLIDSQSDEDYD